MDLAPTKMYKPSLPLFITEPVFTEGVTVHILGIKSLFFLLPEDFSGDLSQALRLLADYHDQVKGTNKPIIREPDPQVTEDNIWESFLKDIPGMRVAGMMSVMELCKDPLRWEYKDPRPPQKEEK